MTTTTLSKATTFEDHVKEVVKDVISKKGCSTSRFTTPNGTQVFILAAIRVKNEKEFATAFDKFIKEWFKY
jgi:hypothetical protein